MPLPPLRFCMYAMLRVVEVDIAAGALRNP